MKKKILIEMRKMHEREGEKQRHHWDKGRTP